MIITTGYKLPQSVIHNAGWTNENNLFFKDGSFAYVLDNNNRLVVGNYNLNIPQNSAVYNIEVVVTGYRNSFPTTLKVWAIDDTSGVEQAYPLMPDFNSFTGANTSFTLNTLFGKVWSVDEINNIKIAIEANGEIYIDSVALNVSHYDIIGGPWTGGSDGGGIGLGNPVCSTVMDEFIQAQPFELARSIQSDDTYAILKSFSMPNGVPITMGMVGGVMYGVFEQGAGSQEETVSITDIVHNYNGTGLVKVDFDLLSNRGLDFSFPYASVPTNIKTHIAGKEFVLSNPAVFYTKFLKDRDIGCSVSAPISVADEGVTISTYLRKLDFKGIPVTALSTPNINGGENVTVTITGAGGTIPPQITHVTSSTTGNTVSPTLSWLHETSGVDRLLIVDVTTEQTSSITGVTYNSLPLTLHSTSLNVSSNVRLERWVMTAPTVGIYPIVVNVNPVSYITAGARSFSGVDQTTPFDGLSTQANGTGTTIISSQTTATQSSIVLDALGTGFQPITHTATSGQNIDFQIVNACTRQISGGSQNTGSVGIFPTNYSLSVSTGWAILSDAVKGITLASPVAGQNDIQFQDEGINLGTTGTVNEVDFTGAGVTATRAGNKLTVNVPGGGGSGQATEVQVTQVAHGFVLGDWIRSNNVSGQFTKAQADIPDNSEVVGIVSQVIDANTFKYTTQGKVSLTTGFTIGDVIWLSPTIAGAGTTTKPTTIGQVSKPLGVVIATGEIEVNIMRGDEITSGSGSSGSIVSPGNERFISSNNALLEFGNYIIAQNSGSGTVHKAISVDNNNTYQSTNVPQSIYTPPWGATVPFLMYLTISEDKSKIYQTRNYSQGIGAQQALVVDEIDTSLNILNTYEYVSSPTVIQHSRSWTFVDGNKIIISYTDTPTAIGNPFFATEFTMSGASLITPTATNIIIGTQGVGTNDIYGYGYKHTDGFVYLTASNQSPQNMVVKYTYSTLVLSSSIDFTVYETNLNGVIPTSSYTGFQIIGTDVGWYSNSTIGLQGRFIYQIYPF